MPTPIRIVVHFDDGSSRDINVRGMSSVFFGENAAVKCGRRPPYKQGPPPDSGKSGGAGGEVSLMSNGDACYWVDGVIICP